MKYKLQDLIDIEQFQYLQDKLNEIYSFPSAIIDNDGNILTATAWQDICTEFHRKNKDCERDCIISDQYIQSHLQEANPAVSYRCPRGLVDNATPIIIDGVHYGNYFTGQFFLEKPELDFFRAQAKMFGFDETAYLEAVKKVPVWSKKQLESYLYFIKGLILIISESGIKKLKEIEARKQIKESEERYGQLFNTSPDGIVLIGSDGFITDANFTQARMYGYDSPGDIIGVHAAQLIAPSSRAYGGQNIERRLSGEDIPTVEYELVRKDGTTFFGEILATIMRNPDGAVSGYICVTRDITERKQAEKALVESQALQMAIFESTNDMIWSVDPVSFGLLTFNQSLSHYIFQHNGVSIKVGMRPEDIFSDDDYIAKWRDYYSRTLTEGPYNTENRSPAGAKSLLLNFNILKKNDTVFGISVFGKDTTELKLLTEKMIQSQKLADLGTLAAGVAHEVNTPLQIITGSSGNLLAKLENGETNATGFKTRLERIDQNAWRIADIVHALLIYARSSNDPFTSANLNNLVKDTLLLTEHQLHVWSNINVVTDLAENLPEFLCDRNKIIQALINLLNNARDAMPRGGKLTIRTAFDPQLQRLLLAVSDTGEGIPKALRSKIFDPFFTTKPVGQGTGLGLSIVVGIVHSHGGEVKVESEPGQGSTFTLSFALTPTSEVQTNPYKKGRYDAI